MPVPLQHSQEFQCKCLVFPVSAFAAVLLECAHDKNVDEMERVFGDFINGIAAYDELHMRKVTSVDV